MANDLWERPSPECTWLTRDLPELSTYINAEHSGEFQCDNWRSVSTLESVQYQGQQQRERHLCEVEEEPGSS